MVVVLDSTVREGELQPGVYFDPKTRKEICLALAETGTRRIEFPIVYPNPNRGGKISDIQDAMGAVRKHFEEVQTIVQSPLQERPANHDGVDSSISERGHVDRRSHAATRENPDLLISLANTHHLLVVWGAPTAHCLANRTILKCVCRREELMPVDVWGEVGRPLGNI